MRTILGLTASAILAVAATPALAAPTVDGTVSAGEYGAPTAIIATDPAAPTSNFGGSSGAPGGPAVAGYNIYLSDIGDTLYGAVAQTDGVAAGGFANLYFDINPDQSSGSEFGIEVVNKRGFVAGVPDSYFDLSSAITFTSLTTGGLITTEFAIDESVFRSFIAGAAAQGYFGAGGYTPQDVRLNLSQSLSYSVVGGDARYERLGRFSVAASDVPEPASWR